MRNWMVIDGRCQFQMEYSDENGITWRSNGRLKRLTPAINELTDPETRSFFAVKLFPFWIGRTVVGNNTSKLACSFSAGSWSSYWVKASIFRSRGSPANSPLIRVNVWQAESIVSGSKQIPQCFYGPAMQTMIIVCACSSRQFKWFTSLISSPNSICWTLLAMSNLCTIGKTHWRSRPSSVNVPV